MKCVVIYKSKTGFTKKYAEWLTEELSANIFEASKVTSDTFNDYDTVIYGGSLYAVGILGVKLITENLDKLNGKKVIVFATGASPVREEAIHQVRDHNFTPEQQKQIRFYYLRGGFDYNKLNMFDKILMTLLKWKISLKKPEERTADEKGMLAAYEHPEDFTRKKNIADIVSYAKS